MQDLTLNRGENILSGDLSQVENRSTSAQRKLWTITSYREIRDRHKSSKERLQLLGSGNEAHVRSTAIILDADSYQKRQPIKWDHDSPKMENLRYRSKYSLGEEAQNRGAAAVTNHKETSQ